jgi:hypothetical protein
MQMKLFGSEKMGNNPALIKCKANARECGQNEIGGRRLMDLMGI